MKRKIKVWLSQYQYKLVENLRKGELARETDGEILRKTFLKYVEQYYE